MPLLVSVILILTAVSTSANAQDRDQPRRTEASLRVYADDDHVTVVSPSVMASSPIGDAFEVEIASTVDVVSAASVDVITSASPGDVSDVRVEGRGTVAWALSPTLRLRTGGIFSHESDYNSYQLGLGGQIEVAQRNATIDVFYAAVFDDVGNAVDSTFKESRQSHIATASFTQILDAKTYIDAIADLRHLKGYHASPYRQVQLRSTTTPIAIWIDERTPTIRRSGAALLRIRRAIDDAGTWFAHASYRFYADSWDIKSHTLDAWLIHSIFQERALLGLLLRGYTQGSADFYQSYYQGESARDAPRYRSKDRTFGGMRTLHASLTLDVALGHETGPESWRLRTMLSTTQFRFVDFPAQRRRHALILGVSLMAPF